MKTIVFYSYKGGVGRSLALAYTARYLADNNFSVCIVDADLEAPGIIYKFEQEPDHSKLGLLDYIHTCITDRPPETISDYFYSYPHSRYGYIKVMSAGRGLQSEYWNTLGDIDWNELFFSETDNIGLFIFEALKYQIETQIGPDYLFIDSRSGVTILSKLCSSVLADTAIILMANNPENFHGSRLMFQHISASKYKTNRKKTEVYCVLTRVSMPHEGDSSEKLLIDMMIQALGVPALDAPMLKHKDITVIHSDPDIEKNEHVVFQGTLERKNERSIQGDYYQLITRIVSPEEFEAKKSIVINNPKYAFIENGVPLKTGEILNRLRGNKPFGMFHHEMETKVSNEAVSCANLYALAVCKRYLGRITDTIAYLSKAVSVVEKDYSLKMKIIYLRGMIFLYDMSNYQEAYNDLSIVCSIDPTYDPLLPYDMAVCLLCLERFDESLDYLDKYLKENAHDYKAYTLRANINYEKLNKNNKKRPVKPSETTEMILNDYNYALELNEDYAPAYNYRGNLHENMGNTDKALSDYNSAIELNPSYWAVDNNKEDRSMRKIQKMLIRRLLITLRQLS